jgi:hypothetical protein
MACDVVIESLRCIKVALRLDVFLFHIEPPLVLYILRKLLLQWDIRLLIPFPSTSSPTLFFCMGRSQLRISLLLNPSL